MECPLGITSPCPSTLTAPASTVFLSLINTLMASQCMLTTNEHYPPDYGPHLQDGEEFDFIVVGAGSAGSVVASRLSNNKNWKILLVEVGTYPSATSEIPGLFFTLQETEENWKYNMEPSENYCTGLKSRRCPCPRGKSLGGSSSINGMIYIRGSKYDYDRWAEDGNAGWNYDSVLKRFKKLEDDENGTSFYGKGGDLPLSDTRPKHYIRERLVDGYKELGYKELQEGEHLGFMNARITTRAGTRVNSAKAFLSKVKDNANLRLALNARVTKLLIDRTSKTAKGVEIDINGKTIKVRANMEVILSAGTINSPQILMNSGIGPKDHLENLGIDVLEDLKVGENFQDHFTFHATCFTLNSSSKEVPNLFTKPMDDTYEYFMYHRGTLSNIGLINFIGFVNPKNNSPYPTIEQYYLIFDQNQQFKMTPIFKIFDFTVEMSNTLLEHNRNSPIVIVFTSLTYSKSRGRIMLKSKNPFDSPLIIPNFLSDDKEEDLSSVIDGIRFAQKMMATRPLARYQPKLVRLPVPNCKHLTFDSDNYWQCIVRSVGSTLYHSVGTCKMGPATEPTAVVDPRLKVYGIEGLRVIDGSIMPKIISCNTNAAIMMIGEKGAELIKEDWTIQRQRSEL